MQNKDMITQWYKRYKRSIMIHQKVNFEKNLCTWFMSGTVEMFVIKKTSQRTLTIPGGVKCLDNSPKRKIN